MKGYSILSRSPELEPHHLIQFSVIVDLGVMAMKGYSILSRSPELEPHHLIQFRVIVDLGVMAMKGYFILSHLQNWSLTISRTFMSYPGHPFLVGRLTVKVFLILLIRREYLLHEVAH